MLTDSNPTRLLFVDEFVGGDVVEFPAEVEFTGTVATLGSGRSVELSAVSDVCGPGVVRAESVAGAGSWLPGSAAALSAAGDTVFTVQVSCVDQQADTWKVVSHSPDGQRVLMTGTSADTPIRLRAFLESGLPYVALLSDPGQGLTWRLYQKSETNDMVEIVVECPPGSSATADFPPDAAASDVFWGRGCDGFLVLFQISEGEVLDTLTYPDVRIGVGGDLVALDDGLISVESFAQPPSRAAAFVVDVSTGELVSTYEGVRRIALERAALVSGP